MQQLSNSALIDLIAGESSGATVFQGGTKVLF
jgi:hypothetical protein